MLEIFVHITTTVISGCIIALFTHWLRNRKKNDKVRIIVSKRPYNSPFTVQCFNDKTYPGGLLHDPSTFYTEKRRDSKHY